MLAGDCELHVCTQAPTIHSVFVHNFISFIVLKMFVGTHSLSVSTPSNYFYIGLGLTKN